MYWGVTSGLELFSGLLYDSLKAGGFCYL